MEYSSPSSPGISMSGQGQSSNGSSIPIRGTDEFEYQQSNISLLKAQLKVSYFQYQHWVYFQPQMEV
jgi:hypothetical protein